MTPLLPPAHPPQSDRHQLLAASAWSRLVLFIFLLASMVDAAATPSLPLRPFWSRIHEMSRCSAAGQGLFLLILRCMGARSCLTWEVMQMRAIAEHCSNMSA